MAFTISYLGLSCFRIQTKIENEEITIVTDPFDPGKTGLKLPRNLSANVVTVSHKVGAHGAVSEVSGKPFVIDIPGEYELRGIFITGIPSFHDPPRLAEASRGEAGKVEGKEHGRNTVYSMLVEGVRLVHLGDLGHPLSDEQIEKLGNVDILMVPVGGHTTLSAKDAEDIVTEIEPRVVIPMHYQLPGLKEELDGVEKFIKEVGIAKEEMEKFRVMKKELPEETTRLIVFTV